MAEQGKSWTFTQLAGPKKVLTLSDWAAPFGGARVSSVVKAPTRARAERVFYGGGSNVTRHVFGVSYPNWELRGRFMDRARAPMGGAGFAKAKVAEIEAFLADQQPVSIAWGDILFANEAFLVEFEPGWESETDVEWVLTFEIDRREAVTRAPAGILQSRPPADYTAQILRSLEVVEPIFGTPALPGDIFDAIDDLVSSLTGAVGQVLAAAQQIQSFKDATFAQLNRLQAAVATMGRAARALRETFVSIPQEALTLKDNADASIVLLTSQTTVEEQLLAMLDEGTQMDRAAVVARAGKAKTSYVARTGDTWESISTIQYGRPDRAADIREMNGIAPGANPVPGIEYLIPK